MACGRTVALGQVLLSIRKSVNELHTSRASVSLCAARGLRWLWARFGDGPLLPHTVLDGLAEACAILRFLHNPVLAFLSTIIRKLLDRTCPHPLAVTLRTNAPIAPLTPLAIFADRGLTRARVARLYFRQALAHATIAAHGKLLNTPKPLSCAGTRRSTIGPLTPHRELTVLIVRWEASVWNCTVLVRPYQAWITWLRLLCGVLARRSLATSFSGNRSAPLARTKALWRAI